MRHSCSAGSPPGNVRIGQVMNVETLARSVRALQDRQDIRDCVHNYCRGVDRFDRDLLLSVYHSDAIDDHGIFVGDPADFADWAFAFHGAQQRSTQHIVTYHTCELDGDVAPHRDLLDACGDEHRRT